MYNNIGGKIKVLAKIIFIVIAVVAVIGGLSLLSSRYTAFYGFLVMIIVPLVAWISTWLLYGFGELIENSDIIAYNTRKAAPQPVVQPQPVVVPERVQKLRALRDQGLITEEEYQYALTKEV